MDLHKFVTCNKSQLRSEYWARIINATFAYTCIPKVTSQMWYLPWFATYLLLSIYIFTTYFRGANMGKPIFLCMYNSENP